jgi:hypothetical protein
MATIPASQVPPTERVQTSFKQLSIAATSLNSASDELGQVIGVLDAALKKLNLGVSAWVNLASNRDENGNYWSRKLGYGKAAGKWGIALNTTAGNYDYPDEENSESWLFNEAPRWMRVEAVGKIPDLLEALLKQTEDTTKTIKKKTEQALELAQAIHCLVEESEPAEQKGQK